MMALAYSLPNLGDQLLRNHKSYLTVTVNIIQTFVQQQNIRLNGSVQQA